MVILNGFVSIGSLLNSSMICAYLDPGTGSYALQLILASAFGGLFALKQSWRQVRSWLVQVTMSRREAS